MSLLKSILLVVLVNILFYVNSKATVDMQIMISNQNIIKKGRKKIIKTKNSRKKDKKGSLKKKKAEFYY